MKFKFSNSTLKSSISVLTVHIKIIKKVFEDYSFNYYRKTSYSFLLFLSQDIAYYSANIKERIIP